MIWRVWAGISRAVYVGMTKYELRASEEFLEAGGSNTGAIANVKEQIVNPVNRAHKAFMVKVLAILESARS